MAKKTKEARLKIIRNPNLPILKPGIYSGIPIDIYHGPTAEGDPALTPTPSVSSSGLKTVWSKSLRHFFHEWRAGNPLAEPFEAGPALQLGRAAHHLLLGEDQFSTLFVGEPEKYKSATGEEKPWNNNANVCREFHAQQKAAGRTVIKQDRLRDIVNMAKSLQLEPIVQAGALSGYVECSMIVQDKETGLWLRSRPDVIPTDSGDFTDLKTAADVSDVAIFRTLGSFGYQIQAGLIWEIADQLGIPFTGYTLIFVETSAPFCTRVVPLTDEDISRGRRQARASIRRVAMALDRGVWPGPGADDLRPMPLPIREREAIDKRLEAEGLT